MTRRTRAPRRGGPSAASDLMAAVLGRYGLASEIREERIATEWRRLVGPRVAGRAWPNRIRNGVLFVTVDSSPWLHQLSFLTADLLVRINQALGDPPILREIRFQLGALRGGSSDRVATAHNQQQRQRLAGRPLPAPAQGTDLAAIEAEADVVTDPELRLAILDARRRLGI